jgi:hypothetical protein
MSRNEHATRWTCDKCGGSRVVAYPADADVYAVVEAIRTDHGAYAPSCVTDLARIQVAVVTFATPPESTP